MKQKVNFDNLTNKQKMSILASVRVATLKWLHAIYSKVLPEHLFKAVTECPEDELPYHEQRCKEWLDKEGYEYTPNYSPEDFCVVLKKKGKVVEKLEFELPPELYTEGGGNIDKAKQKLNVVENLTKLIVDEGSEAKAMKKLKDLYPWLGT